MNMILNYFKIALRNLLRHKQHAMINIMGLAIAIAACLVIFLVVKNEYSYDTFHKNYASVYQVVKKQTTPDGDEFDIGTPVAMTKALRSDFPNIRFTELFTTYGSQVTIPTNGTNTQNKKFLEGNGVFYGDTDLVRFFDFSWLAGDPSVLAKTNTVVLNRSTANKYFEDWKKATGKYITLDNTVTAMVGGVIEDMPANTDFPFRIIFSYPTFLANADALGLGAMINDWGAVTSNHQIYALLPDAVTPATVNAGLVGFVGKYFNPAKTSKRKLTHFLQPLKNIHFDKRFSNNGSHITSKTTLYTLSGIGVLILLMACINFINLSTALAVKRSKEVGIRKVMGSSSGQLAGQVFIETLCIVLLATVIAVILAYSSLPYLKYIVQVDATLTMINAGTILFIMIAILATTILSGAYPALVLSRFKPVEAMKNKINSSSIGGLSLRRVLVVLQFAFSQILVIATIIALEQMHFIEKADLGFNKEAVLLLHGNSDSTSLAKLDAFKASLLQVPGVSSVSFSFDAPSSGNNWNANFGYNNSTIDKEFYPSLKFADADYQQTFGLKMAAGKFYGNDSLPQVVVNETLVTKLGITNPDEVIGKTLRIGGSPWQTIVGVVKDFKNSSLRDAIPPTIISKKKKYYSLTSIKLKTNNLSKSNAAIQAKWDSFFPEYAYNSEFFDQNINEFYIQEQRMSTLYKVYAFLAIFISCLGLYGLVSFMAVQKTKEVGIRKVLGASVANIVYLFSKEFTILIAIAFLLAFPVGYYMMNNWLQSFVFRVTIGPGVFVIAIVLSILVAWITVGYKAIKAAIANPVKSLRTE
jgi:predicted permease